MVMPEYIDKPPGINTIFMGQFIVRNDYIVRYFPVYIKVLHFFYNLPVQLIPGIKQVYPREMFRFRKRYIFKSMTFSFCYKFYTECIRMEPYGSSGVKQDFTFL